MTMVLRSSFLIVFTLFVGAAAALAQTVPELNLSKSGLALRGVDPVSYFTVGAPKKGKTSISVEHEGGTYRFQSEENKALFLEDPDKYLPAYGGYCAYGTAVGAKVDGDPYRWNIVDGQLYLNINRSVDRTWKRNIQGYIADADANWPDLKYQ